MYSIRYKFDGSASAYKKNCQRLSMMVYLDLKSQLVDWQSVKLRPRSSVAVVAIAKAAMSLGYWRATIVQTDLQFTGYSPSRWNIHGRQRKRLLIFREFSRRITPCVFNVLLMRYAAATVLVLTCNSCILMTC